jgi:hypothetical protein
MFRIRAQRRHREGASAVESRLVAALSPQVRLTIAPVAHNLSRRSSRSSRGSVHSFTSRSQWGMPGFLSESFRLRTGSFSRKEWFEKTSKVRYCAIHSECGFCHRRIRRTNSLRSPKWSRTNQYSGRRLHLGNGVFKFKFHTLELPGRDEL